PAVAAHAGHTAQRHVVGLGARAREHDLVGGGADQRGHLRASDVEGSASLLAEPVQAGRVTEVLAQHGRHGLQHARVERRRGVVIEIDAPHAYNLSRSGRKIWPKWLARWWPC